LEALVLFALVHLPCNTFTSPAMKLRSVILSEATLRSKASRSRRIPRIHHCTMQF